ncbi:hypothetical protein [Roseibium album]|uniref:hypothetical protein n=1 Tax=Roseibium album TaxID=311410 RepID=UPI003BB176E1
MTTGNGRWIKLYDKFTDWEWYSDTPCKVVFLDLLLRANFKPGKYQGADVPAGSVVTGYGALSERCGLSVQQVRTAFTKLLSTSEITVKKHPKFSIVSITKWKEYQGCNSQPTAEQQSSNSQSTVLLEGNNTNPNGLDIPDVRDLLWRDGLNSLKRQTGQPERTCRGIIGKWLKAADDDCAKVLTAINQAEADRVFDPVSWISKAVQPKKLTGFKKWGPI